MSRPRASTQRQDDDARQDDEGGDHARNSKRLAKQRDADQRGEDDRGFAQSSDGGNRRLGVAQIAVA